MDSQIEIFLNEMYKNGIKMNSEKFVAILKEVQDIIKNGKDKTKEELVSDVTDKYVEEIAMILDNRNLIPGYSVAVRENDNQVIINGGTLGYDTDKKVDNNTLFDIASCSKMFTQIIAYNLIAQNYFDFSTPICEIDPRFSNLGDLTIGDITTFNTEFRTPGRIDDVQTKEEAYNMLFNATVFAKNKFNYNDIGMMILKEVIETATGKSFNELFNYYIKDKLNLTNTFLGVPESRIDDLTATPNRKIGYVNDPKAVLLGGYSGHAGVVANSEDLLTVGQAVMDGSLTPRVEDTYTKGEYAQVRGVMGNTYVYHEDGLAKSFVSNNEPYQTFRVQGSTRNVFGASRYHLQNGIYIASNAILFNPSSMDIEYAKELEREINARALENWIKKDPINNTRENYRNQMLIKNFNMNKNGLSFMMIDPRNMATNAISTNPVTELVAEMQLKIVFLDSILRNYENEHKDEVSYGR